MSNTLESLREHITPELLAEAAKIYGETEAGIYKAISSLGPSILAGMLEKSGDTHTLDYLFSSVRNFDPEILTNPERLVRSENGAQNNPKDVSGQFLNTIFGAKTPAIANAVASFSGVKQSSALSLLGVAGPLVMGLLSKKIKEEGLTAFSMVSYLLSQRNTIVSLLPAGVGSLLGMANLGYSNNLGDAKSSGAMNWVWLILLLVGIGAALAFYLFLG